MSRDDSDRPLAYRSAARPVADDAIDELSVLAIKGSAMRARAAAFELTSYRRAMLRRGMVGFWPVGGWLLSICAGVVVTLLGVLTHWSGFIALAALTSCGVLVIRWWMLRAAVERELGWTTTLPFELSGYAAWICHEQNIHVRVEFTAPLEPSAQQLLADAIAGLGAMHRGSWWDPTTLVIWLQPKLVGDDLWVGDVGAMHALVDRVLSNAHSRWGISRAACVDLVATARSRDAVASS